MRDFLVSMNGKKFSKSILSFLLGEDIDELELGKMLSSYLTHALIEAQKSEDPVITLKALHVSWVSEILADVTGGLLDVPTVRERLQRLIFE